MRTLLPFLALSAFGSMAFASGVPGVLPPVKCQTDFATFADWKQDLKQEVLLSGIRAQTWEQASHQIITNPSILAKDKSQGGFYKPFLDFSIPRSHPRIARARALMTKHADLFQRVKNEKGVSPEVIVAFWGMETDFRIGNGSNVYPVMTSMATLAYDCRRAPLFRMNLISALRLLDKGEVTLSGLMGEWAGEMSGLQFTPNNYWLYADDFDRDGRRDPVSSLADMLGTAANVLKDYGWRAGEPYMLEVKVPENMRWEDADMTATKTQSLASWSQQGVTSVTGGALPNQHMQGALLLPMGRLGPAFIAYPNFRVLLIWNASANNAMTAGYLATRIASTTVPAMSKGRGAPEVMAPLELKELQTLLAARGFAVGKIDGFIGTGTRNAVREMQLQFGLPADSYPTHELLSKLRQ